MKAVLNPLHLPDRGDFRDDFAADQGERQRAVIARVARIGEVIACEPAVPFRDLTLVSFPVAFFIVWSRYAPAPSCFLLQACSLARNLQAFLEPSCWPACPELEGA